MIDEGQHVDGSTNNLKSPLFRFDGKAALRLLIGLIVLAIVSWLLIRNVDITLVSSIIAGTSWPLILLTIPIILLSHVVRAQRWKRLLRHLSYRVPTLRAFNAVMVGYAANTILPRAGEILRPLVLSRATGMPFSTALSSVVVERVIDIITLLIGLITIVGIDPSIFARALPHADPTVALYSLLLPLIVILVLLVLMTFSNIGFVVVQRVVRPLTTTWADRLEKVIMELREGAGALTKAHQWPVIIAQTAVIWLLWTIPLWMIANAVSWTDLNISFLDAAVLLTIISIGVTVAPTPGALGVYQGFAQAALVGLYDASAAEGLAFGILAWTLNYGVALAAGGLSFVAESRKASSS